MIISYDEKPGIQAIGNVYPDLMPVEGYYSTIARDYEYKRHGTLSLLAGIDLISGRIYYKVFERHRRCEFVEYLKGLESTYLEEKIIIILDNLKIHTSEEAREYLAKVPDKFEFVFTPKHASWLNIIESFFSKTARSVFWLDTSAISNTKKVYEHIGRFSRCLKISILKLNYVLRKEKYKHLF